MKTLRHMFPVLTRDDPSHRNGTNTKALCDINYLNSVYECPDLYNLFNCELGRPISLATGPALGVCMTAVSLTTGQSLGMCIAAIPLTRCSPFGVEPTPVPVTPHQSVRVQSTTIPVTSRQSLWMYTASVPFPCRTAIFSDHVSHVISLSAKPQVPRFNTFAVIACVADAHAVRNFTKNEAPGFTMRAVMVEPPISTVPKDCSCPLPAPVTYKYFVPKSILGFFHPRLNNTNTLDCQGMVAVS